jgi:hypothetical protein
MVFVPTAIITTKTKLVAQTQAPKPVLCRQKSFPWRLPIHCGFFRPGQVVASTTDGSFFPSPSSAKAACIDTPPPLHASDPQSSFEAPRTIHLRACFEGSQALLSSIGEASRHLAAVLDPTIRFQFSAH